MNMEGWTHGPLTAEGQRASMGCLNTNLQDLKDIRFYRAVLGELLGVMFLVFVGCASPYGASELDHTRVSLSFGLSVATLVWVLSDVSGGHINPAVSFGMLVTRKISIVRCLFYVIAQCIGAIFGSLILKGVICDWQLLYVAETQPLSNYKCGLGLNTLGPGVTPLQGCGIELLITFVLVITVFATCDSSRKDLNGSGPLAIGLSVTMCHLGFIRLTGSSMNTARSFGPAVVLGDFSNHWVYWVGPILGGILAGFTYEFIFAGNAKLSKVGACLKDPNYEADNAAQEQSPDHNKRSRVSSNLSA